MKAAFRVRSSAHVVGGFRARQSVDKKELKKTLEKKDK